MTKGYVAGRAYIKRSAVTPELASRIRNELSYSMFKVDAVRSTKAFRDLNIGDSSGESITIDNYWRTGDFVSLPRQWALDTFGPVFDDRTVSPDIPLFSTLPRIQPRDAEQRAFFDSLLSSANKPGPVQILANATTGAGKTIAQIWLGAALGVRTLSIVDSNKIAAGYLRDFDKVFGSGFSAKYVGRIQQDRCDITKPYSIALVQSLASRKYPRALYSAFGLINFDEVQIYGNPSYHTVLGMFSARVLAGFTATNKKGDFGKVITGYIGKPLVVSTQRTMTPAVHVVTYRLPHLLSVYSDGALVNGLARIADRNDLIADLVVNKGYRNGRICLVMSSRVSQLQAIQTLLTKKYGVPHNEVGLHVAEYEDGSYTIGYSYDSGVRWQRLPLKLSARDAKKVLSSFESGVFNGITIPAALHRHILAGSPVSFSIIRNVVKPSEVELDSIANSCNIVLATDRIFGKGVNYPRLDFGVEATPIGNPTQPIGRITRLFDGKPTPEWWAIYDRYVIDDTPSSSFGAGNTMGDRDLSNAVNAFFDAKHSSRVSSLRKLRVAPTYHKAAEIRRSDGDGT